MREPVISTAATENPVSLEEVKRHGNITIDDDDAYITDVLIPAATQAAEGFTARQLMPATLRLDLDECDIPDSANESIQLPRPPLRAVSSITYTDTAGSTQTWSSTAYTTSVGGEGEFGRVRPAFGLPWPTARQHVDTLKITYTAGFASAAAIPPLTKWAIAALATHYYENRVPVLVGTINSEMPMHVENALMQGPAASMRSYV